jgi:hypothetical protein
MSLRIHVGIINLLNRPNRRQKIISLAAELRRASFCSSGEIVSLNLVEAVDGVSQSFEELFFRYGLKPFSNWAISDPENKFPSSWRKGQTSGGIASGLSHIDTASLLMSSPSFHPGDYLLILEDDCYLTTSDVKKSWDYFLECLTSANRLVPEWEMLMLGAAGHRSDIAPARPVVGSDIIEYAGFSYLTTMYFMSQKGAEKLASVRTTCLSNMLAFDELHNALAGLSSRRDVELKFPSCLIAPLVLLSSTQSLVRQDPQDGVHDTEVSAGSRVSRWQEKASVDSGNNLPTGRDNIVPYKLTLSVAKGGSESINWWRRSGHPIQRETLIEQFGISRRRQSVSRPGMLSVMMKHYADQPIPTSVKFPVSFDHTEMATRTYGS